MSRRLSLGVCGRPGVKVGAGGAGAAAPARFGAGTVACILHGLDDLGRWRCPSTPMELVSRLTEQLATPGTLLTASSTRWSRPRFMPVTLYYSIKYHSYVEYAQERAYFMSLGKEIHQLVQLCLPLPRAGRPPRRWRCAVPAASGKLFRPSSLPPPAQGCPRSRHPSSMPRMPRTCSLDG